MATGSAKGKVLLTGGSGFIASHILDALLDAGFQVIVTTRSDEKGRRIVEAVNPSQQDAVTYAIVENIAKDGAFDVVFKQDPSIDYVVHTASPYSLVVDDPIKEFLDPAIKGTVGVLKSAKAYAPGVKRIVITSSSAAMLNFENHEKVYNETHWAPLTWEDAMDPGKTYRASKVLSEKAAWAFVAEEKPNFDLVVINNTYTFGPVQGSLPSLEAVNTSNHIIRDLISGKLKEALRPTAPVFTWVDVRDVTLAHVRALMLPGAGGNRFYVVGGHYSTKRVADIIRSRYPELAAKLPPAEVEDDFPDDVYGFDNSKSRQVLGLEYRGLEESVVDTVESILKLVERLKRG
ncbi:methylglyoxal reductase (NADPH-dependent) gre2 [Diatrype stigma]|uniref:Methylglyoxal reductase (NADPH-dependent) gre2 n=1 Tax=Diatrype stigma TaxID=117547 RepID=A0AAN9USV0_9PEZI